MDHPIIDANIHEVDTGIYYQVRLHAVPRAGELIKLHSFVEQVENNNPIKHYEVIQIIHSLQDVTERVPQGKHGSHFVNIYVKNQDHPLFEI